MPNRPSGRSIRHSKDDCSQLHNRGDCWRKGAENSWVLDTERQSQPTTGKNQSGHLDSCRIRLNGASQWCDFMVERQRQLQGNQAQGKSVAFKFVLPDSQGFCVRSDFLERRLDGCEHIVAARCFLKPRQEFRRVVEAGSQSPQAASLPALLSHAVGAVVCRDTASLAAVEDELPNRLSFPWTAPSSPPPMKRVAWVKGRWNMDHSRRIWEAASALGIAVVVVDEEGHWLQDPQWSHLREGFIPARLDPDSGFVERLVAAIRSYGKPIHGITTVSNKRMVGVARACERLGLPTSPAASFAVAADKYRSREMEPRSDVSAFKVGSAEDLRARLASHDLPAFQYPVVVKPCIGWGSECISKVRDDDALVQAVEKASARHRTSPIQRSDVMIESYVEGPEIDANIVLLNGEIVFCEVGDDFPSAADYPHNRWDDPFLETSMVLPSKLPPDEIEIVRTSLHQTLLRQGFRTGVFNCEGRVRYSCMRYTVRDGREDLFETEDADAERESPSFYLHEINARPPGYYGNVASNLTHGVDYYALDLLWAVGDTGRFRSLACTFQRGPQWWLVITLIPEDRQGIMKTPDACRDFLEKHDDLRALVPDYMTYKKGGSRLDGPKASQLSFVGYFSVVSRKSREDALETARRIRREFDYELA
ncbi:glutathione synthetase ATP-binding domain-like protein [Xylariaceae sp. FL0016]|nr:glutathione synthetase ATP-binding domain-like protein [Xylariaceae sp. FL0016]